MEHNPLSDAISLKNLRNARSLSQSEVAETIGTNANTVSRWERGIATPSPYYRRKLAELFGVDPQELFLDINIDKTTTEITTDSSKQTLEGIYSIPESDKILSPPLASGETTEILPSEPEMGGDLLVVEQDKPILLNDPSRPSSNHKFPRWVYIALASILIVAFASVSGVFLYHSLQPRPSTNLFPALCGGNFQSTNTSIIPTPATSMAPDGEPIGLSEGATIFDLNRNQQEVQDKLQAAQDWVNNPQDVVSSLTNAMNIDPTDAEAQIYLENWKVLGSNHPHITFVIGVSFPSSYEATSRDALQGAFIAQKECNDRYQGDNSKTQIVLLIANVGGDNPDLSALNATFVADQIVEQAAKDQTIVGIMGWPRSSDSINVNHQLKIKDSNLPMLAACSASGDLTGAFHFFRICPTNENQAQVAINFLLNTKHKKRIAILYQVGTSWSENLKDVFVENTPKSNIVAEKGYSAGDQGSIQSALNIVLAQKPDALFYAGYPGDLVTLLYALPQPNNLVIMGGIALSATNAYPDNLPPDLDHVYFTTTASPNQWDHTNPKPPFFHDYQHNFGITPAPIGLSSIDVGTMLGYDGMLTLLYGTQQVLSQQNTIAPPDLEGELKNIKGSNAIQGVTGRIAFDSNGDQDEHKMVFVEHIAGTNLVIDEQQGCLLKDNCSS